jgi:hypothetical protein
MPRRKPQEPRPFEIVMNETSEQPTLFDLEEHLNGCLAAYQIERTFGAAVALAFEALRGIARDVENRARTGSFRPDQLDEEWIISPRERFCVPWIWIRALSTAWEKYNSEGGPLGRAFGLEGGQGKSPTLAKIMQMIDERAIAHWIWWRVQTLRATGQKVSIEDVIQEAAEKFGKHDITIRRAWGKFGGLEKRRNMTSRK